MFEATTSESRHRDYMLLALKEASKCIPTLTAFCVGCVIVERDTGRIITTGYSRELEGNTHAEANAIDKLLRADSVGAVDLLMGADLYSTLEPCSIRTSGNIPCVRWIIESGIRRVFMGVEEPKDFVECTGVVELRSAGIEVIVVEGDDLNQLCLLEARRGH